MKKVYYILTLLIVLLLISIITFGGYGRGIVNNKTQTDKTPSDNDRKDSETTPSGNNSNNENTSEGSKPGQADINYMEVKPNEAGKIMVVMFHNFVEAYKSGDKEYTTTFGEFRKLLQTLYDRGYRLISVSDYLNNNISVPAGCIPMVFTFDDGTSGQFSLIEENGRLAVNTESAVGIMEEFNSTHPDFALKGTFYVNLGLKTFGGEGTTAERLKYLINKGFEIGNHTLTHVKLTKVGSADEIQQEIGGNQKKMYELIVNYKMNSFSLPYGLPSAELQSYVVKGIFEGVKYENSAILEVGWDPAVSPVSKKFDPLAIHRVRAAGVKPVEADLSWWLSKLPKSEQYISDGDPNTIAVPKANEADIDISRLNGKKVVLY